jgi:hypothetical protein
LSLYPGGPGSVAATLRLVLLRHMAARNAHRLHRRQHPATRESHGPSQATEPPVAERPLQQAARGDPGSTGSGSTGLNFNQGACLHWLSFSGPAGLGRSRRRARSRKRARRWVWPCRHSSCQWALRSNWQLAARSEDPGLGHGGPGQAPFSKSSLLLWARTGGPGMDARLGDGLLAASLSWGHPMGKESSLSPFQASQQVPDEFIPGLLEPGDSGCL